ncbi:MAG: hypothetical protein K0Q87_4759 [Neobacillus sp.]|jgi:hypothetical protein|nr:hypothetical protein [Neobacillus sp.]
MIEISEICTFLNKAAKIMKLYSNSGMSLEEALDDIYDKIKVTNIGDNFDIDLIIAELPHLNKLDIMAKLEKIKKADLLKITSVLGLRISKGQRTDVIIENISNYYSYKILDNDMASRTNKQGESEQNADLIEPIK